jgi:(2R)-3-sulfolactate dehydrogenase (NADP+)
MANKVRLALDAAEQMARRALLSSGASDAAAASTARALVWAEADGQAGHGLSRVPAYCAQVRSGKVKGGAKPQLTRIGHGAARIDAGLGFAYPAIDLAIETLTTMAREQAVAAVTIQHSHHFGQAGAHVERLASAGLLALMFGNTPKAMAFWGGNSPMLGTNPLAFAAPLPAPHTAPLVIDLALSVVARGKIVAAQKAGQSIPADWARGPDGLPTTDPTTALAGTLAPLGGAKGGALALMVEILGAALTASSFGWEASSFFDAAGSPPDMGHLLIALDPGKFSGGAFPARMQTLCAAMAADPGVRLPGSRRLKSREQAQREGLPVDESLLAEIRALHG